MLCFAALDFETANYSRSSACAVGLVKVMGGQIVRKEYRLINPQTYFRADFSENVHGITAEDVKDAPLFDAVWAELSPLLEDVEFIAAHNAPFDRSVLEACCAACQLTPPKQKFVCTLSIARQVWKLKSAGLDRVCDYLGIELDHHHALSDALGCAHIALRAAMSGYAFDR